MKPAAIILAALAMIAPLAVQAGGDPAAGGKLFLQCRGCHTVGPADKSGIGPNLNGVVGAKRAGRPDYAYSAALKAKGGVWNPAALDLYLTRPMAAVPGTKMSFGGITDPKARADVIAYLATLHGAKR